MIDQGDAMKKERKVSWPQRGRAQRELLAAVGVYRRDGVTREKMLEIVASMYDFQAKWDEWTKEINTSQDHEATVTP